MQKFCDWFITTLILLSVIIVFAVTFDLPPSLRRVCVVGEVFASLVFTIEYIVRLWKAEKKLRYVFSPMAIIDLVAILPFYLPMFLPGSLLGIRALRLVRLLRILKLNRYFDALGVLGSVIASKRRELLGSLFFVFLMMLISSLLMYSAEHDAQPEVFKNAASGLWWAVATLTTVGYGDIYPVTNLGRLLGAFIAFSGIAAVAIPTGIITAGLTERIDRSRQAEKDASQDEILKVLLEEVRELKRDSHLNQAEKCDIIPNHE
ncbi:MAG: ion transporter [Kiritimatiellae bacterium]|nr:ion transporter [Kiritimatiellia bacterium]